jgi:hypothetical protein
MLTPLVTASVDVTGRVRMRYVLVALDLPSLLTVRSYSTKFAAKRGVLLRIL